MKLFDFLFAVFAACSSNFTSGTGTTRGDRGARRPGGRGAGGARPGAA